MTNEDAIKVLTPMAMMMIGEDTRPISDCYYAIQTAIKALQERKTGKWIRFVGHPAKWICSNCGRNRLGQSFYCEWCGAKMEFTKW